MKGARHKSRELALQVLYEIDSVKHTATEAFQYILTRVEVSEETGQFARELVEKRLEAKGIFYTASKLTGNFIALLKSVYAQSLVSRASWVAGRFDGINDSELESYMTENVGRWGAEFERLTALRDLELG